jgi:hypothetical protein
MLTSFAWLGTYLVAGFGLLLWAPRIAGLMRTGNAMNEPSYDRRRLRFSLLSLILFITAIGLLCVIPYGLYLVAGILYWLICAAIVVGLLMAVQTPLLWLLMRLKDPP